MKHKHSGLGLFRATEREGYFIRGVEWGWGPLLVNIEIINIINSRSNNLKKGNLVEISLKSPLNRFPYSSSPTLSYNHCLCISGSRI